MLKGMRLSVIIPAHNEEGLIENVVLDILQELRKESICNEIIVVNDNSKDSTPAIIDGLSERYENVRAVHRTPPNGFGRAVRDGIESSTGDVDRRT